MRIAMFCWEFPPLKVGGVASHCYNLTRALAKFGVEIDFFMPETKTKISVPWMNIIQIPYSSFFSLTPIKKLIDVSPYRDIRNEISPLKLSNGKIVFKIQKKWKLDRYNQSCFEKLVKNHKKRPYDLIHCQNWSGLKSGLLAKNKLNLPLIVTTHGSAYISRYDVPYKHSQNWFRKIFNIEKVCFYAADQIIVVSERSRQELIKNYLVNTKKISIIYNGVDTEYFRKRLINFKKKKSKTITVLYLARITKGKGIHLFLKAAKEILKKKRNVKFKIVGTGKINDAKKLVLKLNINKSVQFMGYVPDNSVPRLYASNDIYVLPSLSDLFGITVLEAMCCGIPVVVSKYVPVSKLIKNCIRTDIKNAKILAKNIMKLIENEKLREKVAKGAKREVSKFSWNDVAKETIKVYKKVLKST